MRKLSPLHVEQIRNLRKNGLAYKKIARRLQISPSTVSKYSRNIILSREKKKQLEENQSKNRQKFASNYAREKPIKLPKFDENFANLLGHLFFDGSVSYHNGKFVLSYTNSSKKAINSFNKKIDSCFGLTPSKIYKVKGKNTDWFMAQTYSKKAYSYLKSISCSFSTSEGIGIPKEIINSNFSMKASFLRAFWDDEGSISNTSELTGTSNSEKMIDDLITIHKEFGIICSKYRQVKEMGKDIFHLRINGNEDNFSRFIEKIGFEHAIITRGHHIGKYKKDVLRKSMGRYR
ncbi:MAG: LAGLIDADG family homing endonuclease [Candidatus Diapherotrites archaeon]